MPKEDIVDIEVDPDTGVIKSTTPNISAANHSSAHSFFSHLARLTGGLSSAKKKVKTGHTHEHDHHHEGQGQ